MGAGHSDIDFISVDVEGLDYNVLKSNNWRKYHPHIVLVENSDRNLDHIYSSTIYSFLRKKGYVLYAKTYNTLIFQEASSQNDDYFIFT